MKKAKHIIAIVVLVALSTVFLRWVFTWLFALPTAASTQAGPIDVMFNVHFWLIALFFSLIMVLMLYSSVVFKRKPGDEEDGPHVHGNTVLEIVWTVVPLIIVIALGIWGAVVLRDITAAAPDALQIDVTGRQWSWSFAYPSEGDFQSAEMIVPVNQPIALNMHSEDVLHNFWVPEFRVKQDLVPGRTVVLNITPSELGEYKVRCAEICGTEHSGMLAPVNVVTREEYDAWIAEKNAAPQYADMTPEERGELWYSAEGFGCASCHSLDGTRIVGPTWQGVYGREEVLEDGTTVVVDDAYIRESIYQPNLKIVQGYAPAMPQNYEELFTAKQAEILASQGVEIDIVADLIAFMKTLE
ncbi:MAG: cytochrome c oxidase subunit II [Candidatus Promineifilaceae bacterium]|jgi:cytochrome c oxidase subunit II